VSEGIFRLALERNQAIEARTAHYRRSFEAYGLDYAKGFVASDQGRAPRWYLIIKQAVRKFLGTGLAVEAAHQYLTSTGLDPFSCGRELFQ
jgi:hypothetical protein